MNTKFVSWLTAQLQEREWSQAELARRSGLHKQSVHYYLTQSAKPPHPHALAKIASALGLPVEEVYRVAGVLSSPPEINETIEETLYEMQEMSDEDQQEVLAFVRMKKHLRQQLKKRK